MLHSTRPLKAAVLEVRIAKVGLTVARARPARTRFLDAVRQPRARLHCQRQLERAQLPATRNGAGERCFQPFPRRTKSGDAARLLAFARSAGGRLQWHDHRPAAEAILRAMELNRARRRPGVAELPGQLRRDLIQ